MVGFSLFLKKIPYNNNMMMMANSSLVFHQIFMVKYADLLLNSFDVMQVNARYGHSRVNNP